MDAMWLAACGQLQALTLFCTNSLGGMSNVDCYHLHGQLWHERQHSAGIKLVGSVRHCNHRQTAQEQANQNAMCVCFDFPAASRQLAHAKSHLHVLGRLGRTRSVYGKN